MIKKYSYFIIITLILSSCTNEKSLFVSATNGLNLRAHPKVTAQKITTIPQGTEVIILERTDIPLFIIENNKKLNGQWVKVKIKNTKETGYVFDYYLNVLKPNVNLPVYALEDSEEVVQHLHHELHAKIQDNDTILIPKESKQCFSIKKIADFDQNGYNDVLLKSVMVVVAIVVEIVIVFTPTLKKVSHY